MRHKTNNARRILLWFAAWLMSACTSVKPSDWVYSGQPQFDSVLSEECDGERQRAADVLARLERSLRYVIEERGLSDRIDETTIGALLSVRSISAVRRTTANGKSVTTYRYIEPFGSLGYGATTGVDVSFESCKEIVTNIDIWESTEQ